MPPLFLATEMFKKIALIAIACLSFLAASCSGTISPTSSDNPTSITDANGKYCPVGSEELALNLANVTLTRVPNIPLMYQGYNNIEGPVWHDGALYYSNMGSHPPDKQGFVLTNQTTIWRWVEGEAPQIWMNDDSSLFSLP